MSQLEINVFDEIPISTPAGEIEISLRYDEEKEFLARDEHIIVKNNRPLCTHGSKCVKNCVSIYPAKKTDICYKSAILASLSTEEAKKIAWKYNRKIIKNIEEHIKERFINNIDRATMFLPLSFKQMFKKNDGSIGSLWEDIPNNDEDMGFFMMDIMINLIMQYHKITKKYNSHERLIKLFKRNSLLIDQDISSIVHFAASYDLVGGCPSAKSYNQIVQIEDKKYPFMYYFPNVNSKGEYDIGFLGYIHEYLKENKHDSFMIQVLTPDGSWKETKRKKYYKYSDIQFGVTAKGAVNIEDFSKFIKSKYCSVKDFEALSYQKKEMAMKKAAMRELAEESGGFFSCEEDNLFEVKMWGNIKLYSISS